MEMQSGWKPRCDLRVDLKPNQLTVTLSPNSKQHWSLAEGRRSTKVAKQDEIGELEAVSPWRPEGREHKDKA